MDEVEEVMKLLREANVVDALKLADSVKEKKELAIKLSEFAGTLDWLKGRSYPAGLILLKATELYPEYAPAHYNLGLVLTDVDMLRHHRDYTGLAEREYMKAIDLDPSFAAARYNLALLYYFTGRVGDSKREYRKALELDPQEYKFRELGAILEKS